ncbi:MAG: nuclear transport factor 2 family protein, partial [Dehalococcoidales bacterium]|nr:nuclear transport factor 2 family protein [Dehalococcoidales bacterium]
KDRLEEKLSDYTDNPTVWDPVIRVAGYAEDNTVTGLEAVRAFFTWLANMPPVHARVQNVFGEGDKVAVEWVLEGGEGQNRFEIPCANLYDFINGKILSVRMQFDSALFADIMKNE